MKRIIARLEIKSNNVVKGIKMEGLRKIGNPELLAEKYFEDGADELILSDIVASLYNRNHLYDLVSKICKKINIPIAVGGGIRSFDDALQLLKSGADKITINTHAVTNRNLIKECAEKLGSQCVILEIHAKRKKSNFWEVFTENGRQPTHLNVLDWVEEAQKLGVGEVFIVSVDNDGVCKGPDFELISKLEQVCKVPLIYAGGISQKKDVSEIFNFSGVDGIALSHLLHFNKDNIKNLKSFLKLNNIDIRI
tara:strand:+ start:871 stop:1623 length:753 start_codon:yes stop_codon:yes gene_type:complete